MCFVLFRFCAAPNSLGIVDFQSLEQANIFIRENGANLAWYLGMKKDAKFTIFAIKGIGSHDPAP